MIPMIYVNFELRRDYIVNNFCENRARPQLHCDGKCYLAKKIATANEQQAQQAEREFISKLIEVATNVTSSLTIQTPLIPSVAQSFHTTPYQSPFIEQPAQQGVFRPPIFTV